MPALDRYAVEVDAPGVAMVENTVTAGRLMRDLYAATVRADGGGAFAFLPRRDGEQPAAGRLRGDGPVLHGTDPRHRHRYRAGRSGDGGAQRALVRGLAGGLSPHRPARCLRDVRGLRHGVGVDGRPARQVAPARPDPAVAGVGVLAQRAAHLDVLAQRPQRLLAPGPGSHRQPHPARPRRRAGLAAAGRQHHPVDHRPLPAQHRPRQPHRRRQAEAPAVPHPRAGPPALRPRRRHLGVGQHGRPRRAPRHRPRLRR